MEQKDGELGLLHHFVKILWPVGTIAAFASCILAIATGMVGEVLWQAAITGFMAYVWATDRRET